MTAFSLYGERAVMIDTSVTSTIKMEPPEAFRLSGERMVQDSVLYCSEHRLCVATKPAAQPRGVEHPYNPHLKGA